MGSPIRKPVSMSQTNPVMVFSMIKIISFFWSHTPSFLKSMGSESLVTPRAVADSTLSTVLPPRRETESGSRCIHARVVRGSDCQTYIYYPAMSVCGEVLMINLCSLGRFNCLVFVVGVSDTLPPGRVKWLANPCGCGCGASLCYRPSLRFSRHGLILQVLH